jgi:hypothetical protein
MQPVLTGGCQCGAVRYALAEMPGSASLCHCRMCQKAVGQPFAAYATVAATAFAWTRGDPPAFRSSTAAERHFCPACGTPLSFRYLHKPTISVSVGSLDTPEHVRPTRHVGVQGRLSWLTAATLEALPAAPTVGAQTPPYVRDLTSFQHPDHDTPEGWAR